MASQTPTGIPNLATPQQKSTTAHKNHVDSPAQRSTLDLWKLRRRLDSPHVAPSNFITKEELKWLLAEVLGIQSARPNSDSKDSSINEKPEEQDNDRARIRAIKGGVQDR